MRLTAAHYFLPLVPLLQARDFAARSTGGRSSRREETRKCAKYAEPGERTGSGFLQIKNGRKARAGLASSREGGEAEDEGSANGSWGLRAREEAPGVCFPFAFQQLGGTWATNGLEHPSDRKASREKLWSLPVLLWVTSWRGAGTNSWVVAREMLAIWVDWAFDCCCYLPVF